MVLTIAGCATTEPADLLHVDQLREPKIVSVEQGQSVESADVGERDNDQESTKVFTAPDSRYEPKIASESEVETPPLPDAEFRGSYNNMPVAAFINETFGNQLGLSFSIDSDVQGMDELVSLRLTEEISAEELFIIVRDTLANYGVLITGQQGVFVFSLSDEAKGGSIPLVISGKTLPEVPVGHRPVFVFYPIEVVDVNVLRSWLIKALGGQGVQFEPIREVNAMLLQGKQTAVEKAIEIIDLLDQPTQRGAHTAIVEPVFTKAKDLGTDLVAVLKSQGYDVKNRPPMASILVVGMKSTNQLVILASTKEILEHAINWADTLDRQTTTDIRDGVFSYQVRNTEVGYIVQLLNQLGARGGGEGKGRVKTNFIADTNRNAVVFRGRGEQWLRLLPAIKEMDVPTPSVLVEVLLAEVTLNDQDETGLEFIARSGDVTFSTLGGLGIGSSGLTATLNRAGETRAVLNAFYQNDRANIRSRPRLMVKSGQQARIDVGNEIPFISSTSQSTENPDAPVIQTVSYRKTGVIMQIEPVVHSSGYVDIRITQELSEAQQTSTSTIDSPTIFNRSIETTVTLRDGGSVLLGGLIAESSADSNNGIKGLGRIPGVGKLFRADSSSSDRTELVMMVIPYVIENPDEAIGISDKALEFLQLTR
ncbi:MAG: type II secretion system protein GspD [Pseudomonadales bacterium]|nr:type II secretion system protein GspD [Pseudomonadales bacterium]